MMMYPTYTWTDSHLNHTYPKTSEMNPSHINLNPLYQPWSYAGNYPYLVPHGCCNHAYYGGGPYSFQPHYPHFPPPPPSFHPQGFYSPFPGAYPIPPQHYSAELPRYEYDKKDRAPDHCCECHHRKDEKVKEESQVENKKSDSLVPLLLKNRPDYPIMWVPRGYTDSNAKEMEKYSHNPAIAKHHEPSKQGGNGEKAYDDEHGDRFPFQIFWLPSKNDDVGNDAKENNLNLIADKGSSDEKEIKNECEGDEGECDTRSKHAVQKVIPVKQVATNDEKKSAKVVVNSDSVEKTDNGNRASPKTSRLPPVCLRIDPLPRKKKSSRSPSPTERSAPIKDPKSAQQQAQVLNKSQDEKIEDNTKTADHADKVECDNLVDHGDVPMGEGSGSEKENLEEKKILSEDEAALIIQSVYHGFEVRKSEPLKKLRQIYQVRQQAFELRNRIQDLESFGVDGKKEVIIGETIMSLLLKLDTIQGLHPFVREVRKSVAKELVGLQEKLDSLIISVKSETPTTCGPQQVVMQPEEDVIQENYVQAQAQLNLLENHEPKATESRYGDAEAPNLEQQLQKSNADEAIQDEFETLSDSVICENHEVEATESQEEIGESQLGLKKVKCDQVPLECNEAREVESTMSQGKKCNEPQLKLPKEKLDEVPTECDEAMRLSQVEAQEGIGEASTECGEATGLCKTHELEAIESKEGCNTTIDAPEMELDKKKSDSECDNSNEVEGTVTNNGGVDDMELEHKKVLVQSDADNSSIQEEAELVINDEKVNMDSKLQKEVAATNELEELIRELRGRVKDLEKKLSKSKKIKIKKCSNSRKKSRDCVVQKNMLTKA